MPRFLGRATIRVNGAVIETAKGASLDIGGTKRTSIIVGRSVGYAEETAAAVLVCETTLRPGMSLDVLRRTDNAVIVFEADTGQRYVINEAFLTDTPTMKDGDGGNVALKFEGPAAEEVV